jgi:hypothetical protein
MAFSRFQPSVFGILLLLLCSFGGWQWVRTERSSTPTQSDPVVQTGWEFEPVTQQTRKKIQSHLDRAQDRTRELTEKGFPAIDPLFVRAHDAVLPFSKECMGWRSKWTLVLDAMPFSEGKQHDAFLKNEFERRIFSSDDLEQAIEQTIVDFLTEVRNIESEMLVAMRADIQGLPAFDAITALDRQQLEQRFQQAIAEASGAVGADLNADIHSQVVSLIAGEVLAQVAVRLGVSAGILGTGAASGWATLGVGLIAGLIIDQLVCRIWDWWADPDVELAVQLAGKLSALQQLICEGDSKISGLRGEFRQMAEARDVARRTAIEDMVQQSIDNRTRRATPHR